MGQKIKLQSVVLIFTKYWWILQIYNSQCSDTVKMWWWYI